ncbi:DUF4091 domain-containing protein [bacterium]|nr:DUF4091 domain-containing protein [bacterium]
MARYIQFLSALFLLACGGREVRVFVASDMDKHPGDGKVVESPAVFQDGVITLDGAGNEVVAFQAVLQARTPCPGLDAKVSDLVGPGKIDSEKNIQLMLAHYVATEDASYSWGPSGKGVLPWKGRLWPDALVPFVDPYSPRHEPVAAPFAIDPKKHKNQSVWVDVLIPKGTPAGLYKGTMEFLRDGKKFEELPIALTVRPFNLPDECHVDAFGEIYRETGEMFDSGVKFKEHPERDWPVYKRYVQMAHAHRFLATHRAENGPLPKTGSGKPADRFDEGWSSDWSLYTPYVDPILKGRLFTESEGYAGPCAGVGPTFFPAPFIEAFYGAGGLDTYLKERKGHVALPLLNTFRDNAAELRREAEARGWQNVRWFAYIMDEVDGVGDTGLARVPTEQVIRAHAAMSRIQQALDEGAGGRRINLVWTSHTDPDVWVGTGADLRDTIRWWVPNGHALNTEFFKWVAQKPGQTVWFYHSGRPAIGNHTINQTGIDLRLWGLLCRRYRVNGSFWWSMMNFAGRYDSKQFNPYEKPVYDARDTRWGNGVLFYPGMRLTMIGAKKNIQGPVSSMRMKAYRRGLQDYEYCWLADQSGQSAQVDAQLKALIPQGFSEGVKAKSATWSESVEDYEAARKQIAQMIGIK